MFDLTSINLTKPHTVAVVRSRCRLPFARGILGPGIYHFPNDYRTTMGTREQNLSLKTCDLYYLAGDTDAVLSQIEAIKRSNDPHAELFEALADLHGPDDYAPVSDESANDITNGGVPSIEPATEAEIHQVVNDIAKLIEADELAGYPEDGE